MKSKMKTIAFLLVLLVAAASCKTVDIESAKENVSVVNEEGQTKFILSNLQFEANSAEITPETANTLDYLKLLLKNYDGEEVIITGHAANVGDESAIMAISKERAEAVAAYLIKNKTFKAEAITTVGKGASEPIGDDDTAKENRRVEIDVVGYQMEE
ncbi:MAG: OmpA family protein [Spirochaetales bacterium]|nr:OmpA family protein [Spirochaetales bacterium]